MLDTLSIILLVNKMRKVISFLFLIFPTLLYSQGLRLISILPSYLNENSGIEVKSNNGIWTHNDSGDGPIIYKIDSNGNQLDSIYLNGITAVDFEDITSDNAGNLYIGDIGNNAHNRTDLVIYKIPNPDSISGNNVTPEAIHYSYQDQVTFPDPNQNSDCEALFHFNGNLYLISKNWGSSGYSKLYQLPDSAGTYSAVLLDSFASPLVTAADIDPSGKLAVLSMNQVIIFDNYSGNDFLGGRKTTISFPLTQKEGISFLDSNTLYISQENHRFFPNPKLYVLNILSYLNNIEIYPELEAGIYPNPVENILSVKVNSFY
ncbi:MAG: hypothetical protein ACPGVD_12375, partial [Flavobacteriales bacterium]